MTNPSSPAASRGHGWFGWLGGWCHDHRRMVVALWVGAFVVIGGIGGSLGSKTRSEFTLAGVESTRGVDILEERFGGRGAGETGRVVFRAEQGVDDPRVRSVMEQFFNEIEADVSQVVSVASPYDPGGERQVADRGEAAGKLAYAEVEFPQDLNFEDAPAITDKVKAAMPRIEGVQIELGGQIFAGGEVPNSEALGLAFAIFILIVAFGSVLAMGLPIGVALAGIGMGSIIAGLLSHLVKPPDFAQILGIMIGLGVGIDYALFIVTRFRENLRRGHDIRESVVIAINSAGRAVAFAGITVVISLLGMLIMNLDFVTGMAYAIATVVAATMVASLTLLPALLGFAGTKLEVTRWRGLIAAGFAAVALIGIGLDIPALLVVAAPLALIVLVAGLAVGPLRRVVPRREPKALRETLSYRWSRVIQRHPWKAALGATLALLVLAVPLLSLRLGFSDEGNYPKDSTVRKAYDMLADGFGPGFNGPLILVSNLPEGTDPTQLDPVTEALRGTDDVDFASPAILDDEENPSAVMWRVIPSSAPQDKATTDLVKRLRNDVVPAATRGTGLDIAVSGSVAVIVDFTDYLSERLPYFLAAVLGLSFLLLMVVFRSILVPLKAVIMNLLGIGAAYGVVVAAFQWGWLGPLLDIEDAPIEPFIPMMMFAIVFGLSMDYEVFLLSRVKEEWDRTGDSRTSVADGLASTARVITAAALIMVFVFGSFLLEDQRVIKLFGVGLASAVLLDATIIRMVLVPATMELLGDRNWWLPRWLGRILPTIDVEGHEYEAERERQPVS